MAPIPGQITFMQIENILEVRQSPTNYDLHSNVEAAQNHRESEGVHFSYLSMNSFNDTSG